MRHTRTTGYTKPYKYSDLRDHIKVKHRSESFDLKLQGIYLITAESDVTITLPTAVDFFESRCYIKKIGGDGNVIIIGSIDGASSYTINTNNETVHIVSDGNSWFIL